MYIYAIHPTSFDYGILLNVDEQMFHRFHRTGILTNNRHNGEFNRYSTIMCFCIVHPY